MDIQTRQHIRDDNRFNKEEEEDDDNQQVVVMHLSYPAMPPHGVAPSKDAQLFKTIDLSNEEEQQQQHQQIQAQAPLSWWQKPDKRCKYGMIMALFVVSVCLVSFLLVNFVFMKDANLLNTDSHASTVNGDGVSRVYGGSPQTELFGGTGLKQGWTGTPATITASLGVIALSDQAMLYGPGATPADTCAGSDGRCIRFRTLASVSGTVTMNYDVFDVASFSVQHARYGTDAAGSFQVFKSVDLGVTWGTALATVSVSTTSLSTFTYNTVNTPGKIRFKFVATSTNRMNIDNIVFTYMAIPTTVAPTTAIPTTVAPTTAVPTTAAGGSTVTETFETGTKGSYSPGLIVTLVTGNWNLGDPVLISPGTDANEHCVGTTKKCIRAKQGGTITAVFAGLANLNGMSLYAANYGTDTAGTFKVEKSVSPFSTWTSVTLPSYTLTATPQLITIPAAIQSGQVQIRITITTVSSTSRMNIDNIKFTLGATPTTAAPTTAAPTTAGQTTAVVPTTVPPTTQSAGVFPTAFGSCKTINPNICANCNIAACNGLSAKLLRDCLRDTCYTPNHVAHTYNSNSRAPMYNCIDNNPVGFPNPNTLLAVYGGHTEAFAYGGTSTSTGLINAEHTVPQSAFQLHEPQRSDLHHIFPENSAINGDRANYAFGEVNDDTAPYWCFDVDCVAMSKPTSNIDAYSELNITPNQDADPLTNDQRFEPREIQKRRTARALAYMYTMHDVDLVTYRDTTAYGGGTKTVLDGKIEDFISRATLLAWTDPVAFPPSAYEIDRNVRVANYQG